MNREPNEGVREGGGVTMARKVPVVEDCRGLRAFSELETQLADLLRGAKPKTIDAL